MSDHSLTDLLLAAFCLPIGVLATWVIMAQPMACCTYNCRACDHTFEGNLVGCCPECGSVQVDRIDFHD